MGTEDVGRRVCELSSNKEDAADGPWSPEGEGDRRRVEG